jgi:phosphate transport system protein
LVKQSKDKKMNTESDHIVSSFDEELIKLEHLMAEMGGLAEANLEKSIHALVQRNTELADEVVRTDKQIDKLETAIDTQALRIFALRQPMADDLRAVIGSLKAAHDIERIGDYAKNVAKRVEVLSQVPMVGSTSRTIARMGDVTRIMMKQVIDAFIERDAEKALDVRRRDEEVDQLHTSMFRELLTYMMEDPRLITPCTHLLFITKNIERIGDHATNIAEYVYFIVNGEMPDADRPKSDNTAQTIVEPTE